jgi:hypothetical protein
VSAKHSVKVLVKPVPWIVQLHQNLLHLVFQKHMTHPMRHALDNVAAETQLLTHGIDVVVSLLRHADGGHGSHEVPIRCRLVIEGLVQGGASLADLFQVSRDKVVALFLSLALLALGSIGRKRRRVPRGSTASPTPAPTPASTPGGRSRRRVRGTTGTGGMVVSASTATATATATPAPSAVTVAISVAAAPSSRRRQVRIISTPVPSTSPASDATAATTRRGIGGMGGWIRMAACATATTGTAHRWVAGHLFTGSVPL